MNSRIGFILVLVSFFGIIRVSGGDFPRHVDPLEFFFENPDPETLFNVYAAVFEHVVSGEYAQARQTLGSVEGVGGSVEAMRALDEYNLMLRSVVDELNITERSISEAYSHLGWLREKDADRSLIEALLIIESVNRSSMVLGLDSVRLADVLGGSPLVLLEGLYKVEDFIESLNQRIEAGFIEVEEVRAARLEGLQETVLDIRLEDYSPWVGSDNRVSGKLSTINEVSLGGKVLEIIVDDVAVPVVTNEDGFFIHTFTVPYNYVDLFTMNILYLPSEEDLGIYTPVSESIRFYPEFLEPKLSLVVPHDVYPGMNYTVKAGIKAEGSPDSKFVLELRVFGNIYEASSIDRGEYIFPLSVPSYASDGATKITVTSKPNGIYSQGNLSDTTFVKHVPSQIELDNKYLIISSQTAVISGTVLTLKLPLSNCLVEVQVDETTFTTITNELGEFSIAFPQSLMSLSQRQKFVIRVTPNEPWISKTQITDSILIINALTLLFLPVLVAIIFLNRQQKQLSFEQALIPSTPSPVIVEYPQLRGLPGLYVQTVQLIAKITGEYLLPSSTIIEYLEIVKPKLWDPISGLFDQFSILYERWVYGPNKNDPPIETSMKIVEEMKDRSEQD